MHDAVTDEWVSACRVRVDRWTQRALIGVCLTLHGSRDVFHYIVLNRVVLCYVSHGTSE